MDDVDVMEQNACIRIDGGDGLVLSALPLSSRQYVSTHPD